MAERRKLAAILAADIVGFTRLAGADEERTLARLRALRSDLFDPAVAVHHGRVVKRTGDGALVEFRSVVDAVRCALDVQTGMAERNAGVPEDKRIAFRIGVHLGDVVEESDGDLMGDGVNIAARLEGIAEPGGVCLSEDSYRQVKARLDLRVRDLGPILLKNVAEPVRAYALDTGAADDGGLSGRSAAAPGAAPRPNPPEKPSIAVLAFNNMSSDPEQAFFSDGISEDIITDLSMLSELHVIARNSSFAYKNAAVSAPEAGKALGARYLLEGSVRRAGGRIRVTAQLVDSTTGGHVWASRFDRELTDIFAVQDEITREIVAALKLRLTAGEQTRLVRRRTVSAEAYELMLRAREQSQAFTRRGNLAARALAEAALAIDPHYAAAHAVIAFTHINDYGNGYAADPEASMRLGREAAERALAADEEEPSGHQAMGIVHFWNGDLDRAETEARRGLALLPSSVDNMILLARVQIFAGSPRAALATLDDVMKLDPNPSDMVLQFIAEARFSLGEDELAIDALERRLARNPDSETAWALLASAYGWTGRADDAGLAWERAVRINPVSLERRRQILPFRNPQDFERRVEGLRKAGLQL